jgi:hypothetical protein
MSVCAVEHIMTVKKGGELRHVVVRTQMASYAKKARIAMR